MEIKCELCNSVSIVDKIHYFIYLCDTGSSYQYELSYGHTYDSKFEEHELAEYDIILCFECHSKINYIITSTCHNLPKYIPKEQSKQYGILFYKKIINKK